MPAGPVTRSLTAGLWGDVDVLRQVGIETWGDAALSVVALIHGMAKAKRYERSAHSGK